VILRPMPEIASEFAQAAAVLATATRSWPTLPPATTAQVDAIEHQLQGLRRSLVDLRIAAQPEKR
jgi:hypothetical protein